jgi:anti-anti-sigma factor
VTETHVVEVAGELDLSTVAYWEAAVGRAARGAELVVLDVSRVEFLDSAGVHALFRMLTTMRNQQKRLVIVAPQEGRVRRLIEILDLPSLAWVCETVEEAMAGSPDGAADDGEANGEPPRLPIGRTGT